WRRDGCYLAVVCHMECAVVLSVHAERRNVVCFELGRTVFFSKERLYKKTDNRQRRIGFYNRYAQHACVHFWASQKWGLVKVVRIIADKYKRCAANDCLTVNRKLYTVTTRMHNYL